MGGLALGPALGAGGELGGLALGSPLTVRLNVGPVSLDNRPYLGRGVEPALGRLDVADGGHVLVGEHPADVGDAHPELAGEDGQREHGGRRAGHERLHARRRSSAARARTANHTRAK